MSPTTTRRPLLLLSNDDGHARRGIRTLGAALARIADVVIVAPEVEQSAASHALSLHRPLRARRVEEAIWAVDGTPADCVYVALFHAKILPRKPDLVVSGINHGLNLAQDVFYSGTVAAAREGAMRGIPALAMSTAARDPAAFERVAELGVRIAQRLLDTPKGKSALLLSVNVPQSWNGKLRTARLGTRNYEEVLDQRQDPRGREYLWLGGSGVHHTPDPGSDTDAHDAGFATVTPLVLDLTAQPELPLVDTLLDGV
jgi:5'-nucleotidase